MLQVKSYKSRTPATPRDTKARGKDSRKKLLLDEQVERERERERLNFVLEREKEKLRMGKSVVEGSVTLVRQFIGSATACAGIGT